MIWVIAFNLSPVAVFLQNIHGVRGISDLRATTTNVSILAMAMVLPAGIITALVIGICAVFMCRKNREEQGEIEADENPVYSVFQLGELYVRQYSTNEVLDNNLYYAQ